MKKRDIELLLEKSKAKDEEIAMLREVLNTGIKNTEAFAEQDYLTKAVTRKYFGKPTYRSFIQANYDVMLMAMNCKTFSEMSVAVMEAHNEKA